MDKGSVVILCAGGPAPGINCVISSVTKIFTSKGYRVIGLNGGYKSLVSDSPEFVTLDFATADRIFNKGGSILTMSRYKPKDSEFRIDFFIQNDVRLLVTIGGDDTASTANRLSKFLRANKVDVSNIHVPKTIDNDLPLPYLQPTFGFNTAKEEGVKIVNTIYEDARTSGNWFVISAMGREAGHLAYHVGAATHLPMIIIPEMFSKGKISIDKIVRLAASSVIKREMMGIGYGAIIISEGVFHFLDESEFEKVGIAFPKDDHGHIELNAVSKSHLFASLISAELKRAGLKNKCRPNELGYELRCCAPSAFDLYYTTKLGLGVYDLFSRGISGCMVTLDNTETITPLFLEDVEDEHGKIATRLLDIEQSDVKQIFENNLHYITESDYDGACRIVKNPDHYDYKKILE